MSIRITVNGEPHSVSESCSLLDLLTELKLEGRLAVDVNGEIVPKSTHGQYQLKDDDRVEIVHAIGGG